MLALLLVRNRVAARACRYFRHAPLPLKAQNKVERTLSHTYATRHERNCTL